MNVTMLKDSCKGKDSITVSVSKDNLAKLTESGYIAPIRITSVEGANGSGSKDYGTAYLVVTTQTKLIKDNVGPSDMLGTLVTDYSGWTGSYPDGTSLNVADITNGQLDDDGWRLTTDSHAVIVDMKSVKNVTGIRACRWYRSYWWGGYGYSFSSIALSLSEDGNTWTSAGTADASKMQMDDSYYQYLSLYGAVKARYIKMEYLSGSSSVSSLAELGVYVQ
jgi:F5/8 type C domain.